MGEVNLGIPVNEVLFLKNLMGLNIFIEGGTYKGRTAKKMAKHFKHIMTIEASSKLYNNALKILRKQTNVMVKEGNTRNVLPTILDGNLDNILFWLDSHWSGGETYGMNDECPLIEEIKIIVNSKLKNIAIIIDDAKLFLSPPPKPHDFDKWPSLKDIMSIAPFNLDIVVHNDVIYLLPNDYIAQFKTHLQKQITDKYSKNGISFIKIILSFRDISKKLLLRLSI